MIKSLVYTVEGILTVEYEYNYLGDRISKAVDGEKTSYTLEYSSGLSQVIEETTDGKTVFYVRGLELISREETSGTYFYIMDGGNTVRDLIDEDGTVTDKYIFDSFGNEVSHEGDSTNSYGFQGEQLDEETGLYYLRARYMNSSTGTFTNMDTYGGSLFYPTSLHKYLFANSNPVKYCDPTGHNAELSLEETAVVLAMMTILCATSTKFISGLGQMSLLSASEIAGSISTRFAAIKCFIMVETNYSIAIAKQYVGMTAQEIAIAIEKVVAVSKTTDMKNRIYEVYTLPCKDDFTKILYVGRSKNYNLYRKKYHKDTKPLCNVEAAGIIHGLTYEESRLYEQLLMVKCQTRQWLDETGYNLVNGIGVNNHKYDALYEQLKRNANETRYDYVDNMLEDERLMMMELNNTLLH